MGILLYICCIFLKHLFLGTLLGGCFWLSLTKDHFVELIYIKYQVHLKIHFPLIVLFEKNSKKSNTKKTYSNSVNHESQYFPALRKIQFISCLVYIDSSIVKRNGKIVLRTKLYQNLFFFTEHQNVNKPKSRTARTVYGLTFLSFYKIIVCFFSFLCQDANRTRSNCAIIGCNLSKKHKQTLYKTQNGESN